MGLCKYCESIDPDVVWERKTEGPDDFTRVNHDLQSSHSMWLSAQNGCSGCRFFLDVLRRETEAGDTKVMESFLQQDQRVWIESPFSLVTYIAGDEAAVTLDLCLAQGANARSPQSPQIFCNLSYFDTRHSRE